MKINKKYIGKTADIYVDSSIKYDNSNDVLIYAGNGKFKLNPKYKKVELNK